MSRENPNQDLLLAAPVIKCRGANESGKPVLRGDMAEQVIVKIYKDGRTEPLCRYAELSCVAPRCNPKRVDTSKGRGEDNLGLCPYATKS